MFLVRWAMPTVTAYRPVGALSQFSSFKERLYLIYQLLSTLQWGGTF